jgi:hypothetical protein
MHLGAGRQVIFCQVVWLFGPFLLTRQDNLTKNNLTPGTFFLSSGVSHSSDAAQGTETAALAREGDEAGHRSFACMRASKK